MIQGAAATNEAEWSVCPAGDALNGDDPYDLSTGIPNTDGSGYWAADLHRAPGQSLVGPARLRLAEFVTDADLKIPHGPARGYGIRTTLSAVDANSQDSEDLTVGAASRDTRTWAVGQTLGHYGFQALAAFNLIPGTKNADTLVGTELADDISGLAGKDSLSGLGGNDRLFGGKGADVLQGGLGDDLIDGDEGSDTASYGAALGPIVANLTTGVATGEGTDNLVEIENLIGSGFDDQLSGNGAKNTLEGGAGNDVLSGLGDADRLLGGLGDDLLIGGKGDDQLLGGAGNDRLVGGQGNDSLNGGDGIDTADYSDASKAVTVDLGLGTGVITVSSGVATRIGEEFLVNTQTYNSQRGSTITGLTGGGFVVAWEDFSGTLGDASSSSIKAQMFDAAGTMIGEEFLVNTQTASYQSYPAITGLTGGGFVVSWWDESSTLGDTSGTSIKAQMFDAAGARIGGELLVNTQTASYQYYPTITGLTGGGFVVTWQDYSGTLGDADGASIKAQMFDAAGAQIGGEFLVNTQTASSQYGSTITGLTGGGFVVTWQDYSGTLGDADGASIKAQMFDAAGARMGGEFLVNTQTTDNQYEPTITALTGGGFVVTWMDFSGTLGATSRGTMKAQMFDAAGARIGVEFLVNNQTAGDAGYQYEPTITGLVGGGFVVTWYDDRRTLVDASPTSIKAQMFDAAGARIGGEFVVNTQTYGGQVEPSITSSANGGFVVTWTDLSPWGAYVSGSDIIKAQIFGSPFEIDSFSGIENLIGSVYNDNLKGNSSANVIEGRLGDDLIDGGEGSDTASYVAALGSIIANLTTGVATGEGTDTLLNIENLTGSGFNDQLTGNSAKNSLDGGADNDTLSGLGDADRLVGGLGDDLLIGGKGNDDLIGGEGIDTASYTDATSGVTVVIQSGAASGGDGADLLDGIENLIGSAFDDALNGYLGANRLDGGQGNDTMNGFGGDDVLLGGQGDDALTGGAGNDQIDGGEGNDTADYATASGAVTASLLAGSSSGAAGVDAIVGIENLAGSVFDDVLAGDGGNNRLAGAAGDDVLTGGVGNDTLIGGDGIDTASYADAASGVTVVIQSGAASGGAGTDVLDGIENLIGSAFDDALNGHTGTNRLEGGLGNDTINGFGGDDVVLGDEGDDALTGGAGNDQINGGEGNDTADYYTASGAVTVSLTSNTSSGAAGVDALVSIENLKGSAFGDSLTGDAGANTLDGAAGNDTIDGAGGDDRLMGGSGSDTLSGGDGVDTADYSNATGAVTASLATGTATRGVGTRSLQASDITDPNSQFFNPANGHIYQVVNAPVTWTEAFNASSMATLAGLTGYLVTVTSASEQAFVTTLARSRVTTGFDNCSIWMGATDLVEEGAWRWVSGPESGIQFWQGLAPSVGGVPTDQFYGPWGTIGPYEPDNPTTGGYGPNGLWVSATGEDYLFLNAFYEAGYWSSGYSNPLAVSTPVSPVSSADGYRNAYFIEFSGAVGSASETDTLLSIENLIGSAFDDVLDGNNFANRLEGGLGNDRINGFGGDDVVLGGEGDDALAGGTGNDQIDGGVGSDTADYFTASGAVVVSLTSNTSSGAAGVDTLVSIENLNGSAFADSLTGDAAANTLNGAAGNDSLTGGDGNDLLVGGDGDDSLDGGDGIDTVDYSASDSGVTASLQSGLATLGANPGVEASTGPVVFNSVNSHYYEFVGVNAATWSEARDLAALRYHNGMQGYLVTITSSSEQLFLEQNFTLPEELQGLPRGYWFGASDDANEGNWVWMTGPEAGTVFYIEGAGAQPGFSNWEVGQPDNFGSAGPSGQDYGRFWWAPSLKWDDGGESEQGTGFLVEYGGMGSPSETDTLLNIENLTGSAFDDTLTGNRFANRLDGGAGNDILVADQGADILIGGLGADIMDAGRGEDILIGGAGADTLTGGTSSDIFRYLDLSDSTAAGRDLITDLLAVDVIDLSAIDADSGMAGDQAFLQVAAFTGAAGQMVLTFNAGTNKTLLALDVNGDGVSDFELLMTGSHLDSTGWAL